MISGNHLKRTAFLFLSQCGVTRFPETNLLNQSDDGIANFGKIFSIFSRVGTLYFFIQIYQETRQPHLPLTVPVILPSFPYVPDHLLILLDVSWMTHQSIPFTSIHINVYSFVGYRATLRSHNLASLIVFITLATISYHSVV